MDTEEIKQRAWSILPEMTDALKRSLGVRPKYNAMLTRSVGIHPMPKNRGNGNFLAWTLLRDERTSGGALRPGALDPNSSEPYTPKNLVASEADLPENYQDEIEAESHLKFQAGIQGLCELLKTYIKANPEKAYGGAFLRDADINLCEASASGEFVDYLVKALLHQGVLEYTGLPGPRGAHMLRVADDKPYAFQPAIPAASLRRGVSAGEALAAATVREILPDLRLVHQKKWRNCRDKKELPFDFYSVEHDLLIEVDGAQHFRPVEYFGGTDSFLYTKRHDRTKNFYAADKDIRLVRIDSTTRDVGEIIKRVYSNLDDLPSISLFGDNYGLDYCEERVPDDVVVSFDHAAP